MPLTYVGPRVNISQSGISFDTKKIDKYRYLQALIEITRAIDHSYEDNEIYSYDIKKEKVDKATLLKMITPYLQDLDTVVAKARKEAEKYTTLQIERVQNSHLLHPEEQEVMLKNLTLMRNYNIQRHINKTVYYLLIQNLTTYLRHNKITYISAPIHENYLHLFSTLQKALKQQRSPINSETIFHRSEDTLHLKLLINN